MTSTFYTEYAQNPVRSWKELVAAERRFETRDQWAFRGQNTLKFPSTSLERHCKSIGLKGESIADLEVKLIRDFARRYHLYDGFAPPPRGHTLQWLSLLQHYGTPTRLLDFTYSFFIATFFALETAGKSYAVWCVNVSRLKKDSQTLIEAKRPDGAEQVAKYQKFRDTGPFRRLFMCPPPIRFAYPTNPIRLNQRLTIQQGVFIAPGDITATFEQNVRAIPHHRENIVRVIIDRTCRQELLRKLHRFGINTAALFPGLEGFARSLRTASLILSGLPVQSVEMLEQV